MDIDHKPTQPNERERILSMGIDLVENQVTEIGTQIHFFRDELEV